VYAGGCKKRERERERERERGIPFLRIGEDKHI
jgi:hypothetical protein